MNVNEISLKNFVKILSKSWKWIVVVTFASFLISIITLIFFNSTSYQIIVSGNISRNSDYNTRLGTYPTQEISSNYLINMVNDEEFLNYINFTNESVAISTTVSETGVFTISLSSNNISIVEDMSEAIVSYFEDYVNFTFQKSAFEYFDNVNRINTNRVITILNDNTQLIALLSDKMDSIDRLITNEVISPEYQFFSSQRASLEYENMRLQYEIENNKYILDQLEKLQSLEFTEYLKTKDRTNILEITIHFDLVTNLLEDRRFNPMTFVSALTIMGMLLCILCIYLVHYWRNES